MIVATMMRTALLGYRPIVFAQLETAVISFALWVHHMFATGMPRRAANGVSATRLTVGTLATGIASIIGAALHFVGVDAIDPTAGGRDAAKLALFYWQVLHVAVLALMIAFALARLATRRLDSVRCNVFDNTYLMSLRDDPRMRALIITSTA